MQVLYSRNPNVTYVSENGNEYRFNDHSANIGTSGAGAGDVESLLEKYPDDIDTKPFVVHYDNTSFSMVKDKSVKKGKKSDPEPTVASAMTAPDSVKSITEQGE